MQELHLVGMTRDLDGLIFSSRRGAKSGGFVVPIDAELIEAIGSAARLRRERSDEKEPPPHLSGAVLGAALGSRPESRLTPRDIQARLRAGHSIAQVARAAGVPAEWIERFAAPVEAEQARVVETALRLRSHKARVGDSALALSESVRMNLFDKGVALVPEPGGWGAYNIDGSRWLVCFDYVSRRRPHRAEWELDFESRTLTPRNRTATELGYVDAARGRRTVPSPPVAAGAGGSAAGPTRPPAGAVAEAPDPEGPEQDEALPVSRRARGRRVPAKRTAARTSPVSTDAPARKAPARKAPARKAPARKAVAAKRGPARESPARRATTSAAAPASKGVTRKRRPAATRAAVKKGVTRKRQPAATRAAVKKGAPTRRSSRDRGRSRSA